MDKRFSKEIQIGESLIQTHLDQMVRSTVEKTLNGLLQAKADTKAGEVELKMPKLRYAKFETEIVNRYSWKESLAEEVLMEMYLAMASLCSTD